MAFLLGGAMTYWLWPYFDRWKINPLECIQKIAFVAAAFSVTAYNLRVRVIDMILKVDSGFSNLKRLCDIARACCKRLTDLVLLFTFTAMIMAASGFLPITWGGAVWYASVAVGLFGLCIVQITYVFFAFEVLEEFMFKDAESKAKKKEIDRLTKDPNE